MRLSDVSSLQDLLMIPSRGFAASLWKVIKFATKHVYNCRLCCQKGIKTQKTGFLGMSLSFLYSILFAGFTPDSNRGSCNQSEEGDQVCYKACV